MADRICSIPRCERPFVARGYCAGHWRRWRLAGDPQPHLPLRVARPRGSAKVRDEQGRKFCPRCAQWLPESQFCIARKAVDGRTGQCKTCAREGARLVQFNLTPEQYHQMVADQGGKCAICRRSDNPGGEWWDVDHDHACCSGARSCGKCVRGLLCRFCNTALGLMQDDPSLLAAAITYLGAAREA